MSDRIQTHPPNPVYAAGWDRIWGTTPKKQPPKTIPLSQEKTALIDAEDYERVSRYRWYAVATPNKRSRTRVYYAATKQINGTTTYLHRWLLGAASGTIIDHQDHNTLNNQKHNLRPATSQQNQRNAHKTTRPTTSPYKGVCWRKDKQQWRAYINFNGHDTHLGYFDDPHEAAQIYNLAAMWKFGNFTSLNLLPSGLPFDPPQQR